MKIALIKQSGSAQVVQLKGKITLGQDCAKLRELADGFFDQGKTQIVLNLSGVDYVDSAGLGAIASCYVKARAAGGSLTLCNVSPAVEQLLVLTRLNEKISAFPDEDSALAGLDKAA